MHLLLSAEESEAFLIEELRRGFQYGRTETLAPRLVTSDIEFQPEAPPTLVFARQLLSDAQELEALSITQWSERLFVALADRLPEDRPWRLHVFSHYSSGHAGQNRCRLIRESLMERLRRKHRRLLRSLAGEPTPFTPSDSLVQLLLTAPDRGFISVTPAPRPFQLRRILSPFPKGEIPIASDKGAPSRAFAKLLEAEIRLGRNIVAGETCADLGASPGSWSYVALQRGATIIAVDRAPLRADLMRNPRLRFIRGDAFSFAPTDQMDWLLCDVIAAPERSLELLFNWLKNHWARRFIVTIKFKGREDYVKLEQLKPVLTARCEEFGLTRLCANRNEACAFGVARAIAGNG